IPLIENVDLLYHESTFLEQHHDMAAQTGHSTAKQAAIIAQKAGVGNLTLGHYSTRYKDLELFRSEARSIFDKVELAEDGKEFTIKAHWTMAMEKENDLSNYRKVYRKSELGNSEIP